MACKQNYTVGIMGIQDLVSGRGSSPSETRDFYVKFDTSFLCSRNIVFDNWWFGNYDEHYKRCFRSI